MFIYALNAMLSSTGFGFRDNREKLFWKKIHSKNFNFFYCLNRLKIIWNVQKIIFFGNLFLKNKIFHLAGTRDLEKIRHFLCKITQLWALVNAKITDRCDFPSTWVLSISQTIEVPKIKGVGFMVSGPGGYQNLKIDEKSKKIKYL